MCAGNSFVRRSLHIVVKFIFVCFGWWNLFSGFVPFRKFIITFKGLCCYWTYCTETVVAIKNVELRDLSCHYCFLFGWFFTFVAELWISWVLCFINNSITFIFLHFLINVECFQKSSRKNAFLVNKSFCTHPCKDILNFALNFSRCLAPFLGVLCISC